MTQVVKCLPTVRETRFDPWAGKGKAIPSLSLSTEDISGPSYFSECSKDCVDMFSSNFWPKGRGKKKLGGGVYSKG